MDTIIINVPDCGMQWSKIISNTTAVVSNGYLIDASSNSIVLTLPASPETGKTIGVKVLSFVNTVTIARNGSKIEGLDEDMIMSSDKSGIILVYSDNSNGWVMVTGSGGVIETRSNDNIIRNGNFLIAQRGTVFTAVANGAYTLDRFSYGKTMTAVHTISQDSDVPTFAQAGINTQHSLKIACTAADTDVAADDRVFLNYKTEGYDIAPYMGGNLMLSFWAKATKAGVYCLSASNAGADRSFVAEYTIANANTWELKKIAIPLSCSTGTWNYTNGLGLSLSWTLASGSTYQTSSDTWQSGAYMATANQVNACDSTDNNFWLANVKLEPGSSATQFEPRPYTDELRHCQRYFQKSYELSVVPGTDTLFGYHYTSHHFESSATVFSGIPWPVEMRSAPTVIIYEKTGTPATSTDADGTSIANTAANTISTKGFRYLSTDSSSSGLIRGFHYTANAEL